MYYFIMTEIEQPGQWVDIPQYPNHAPTMARPAYYPPGVLSGLAENGTVIAIGLLLLGAIAAIVFIGAIKDASYGRCRGK